MNKQLITSITLFSVFLVVGFSDEKPTYPIVDTGQNTYYSNNSIISFTPNIDDSFYGQDATYKGYQASYTDNNNGTISDNITGLMWAKGFSEKLSFNQALNYANESNFGGYNDWRIPTIKELYSLINFNGKTGKGSSSSLTVPRDAVPYINTEYFDFEYSKERRYIDAQYWTSTDYTSTTMNGSETFFGVNFADGRIKGYPKLRAKYGESKYYLRLVRGNKWYGKNIFINNKNGTITDIATNLIWMKDDSKKGINWEESLEYCENLNYANISKWRLPNAKELQSLVDYTKSPSATNSAAIDSIFSISTIENEGRQKDYPSFWSSTTHLEGKNLGESAVYISFGRALGYMKTPRSFSKELMDVHGAGAQRSDPKTGTTSWYLGGRGPQGDVVRIKNYVRCVADSLKSINRNINIERRVNKLQNFKVNKNNHPALDRFDKNDDSKISYEEAPKKMQYNFHKHDLNKDGFINIQELKTLPKRP